MQRRSWFVGAFAVGLTTALKAGGSRAADQAGLSATRPEGAISLFDGRSLTGWLSRKGGPADWVVRDGYMVPVPGSGDIYSQRTFQDHQLHVEFWLPAMPAAKGQARANSGVYIQGRYEVQVLDSYGVEPKKDDCAAIYGVAAPLRNASRKPQTWQTYDIAFRAPRFEQGRLVEKARITLFHNNVMVQNNLEVPGPTPAELNRDLASPGPVLLQAHGDLVRYRNIWVLPING